MKRSWATYGLIVILAGCLMLWHWYRRQGERRFDAVIQAAARRYGVEPALVKAVMWRESRFNPYARGRAGEIGLMQIRDLAAREWADAERLTFFSVGSLQDARMNALCGTWYLAKLLRRYQATDNPLPYALADYNAGRAQVLRWNKGMAATNSDAFLVQINYPGTLDYILSVTRRYRHYRSETADRPDAHR